MSKRKPASVKVYLESYDAMYGLAFTQIEAIRIRLSRNELNPLFGVFHKLIEWYE